jgi:membrane-bound metal-dependent hydrolase YbcI (DUF457 family)
VAHLLPLNTLWLLVVVGVALAVVLEVLVDYFKPHHLPWLRVLL